LIFDGVKEGVFTTALLMATYGGASGKKWAFLVGGIEEDSLDSGHMKEVPLRSVTRSNFAPSTTE
jgi:hypothetical protein